MEEFVKYLASLGVGGCIAGLIFLVYRKDMKTLIDEWKGLAAERLAFAERLIDVINDNIRVQTELVATIKSLHKRFDDEAHARLTARR